MAAPAADAAGVAGVATVAGAPAPAGEGVAGAAFVVLEDWVGAAGGAGVDTEVAGAGVEGAFEEDAVAAGALGCRMLEISRADSHGVFHTLFNMQTMKPFSSIL